jgi:hypothetical protein
MASRGRHKIPELSEEAGLFYNLLFCSGMESRSGFRGSADFQICRIFRSITAEGGPNCIRPGIERNGVRDAGEALDDLKATFAATYCRLETCDKADYKPALQGEFRGVRRPEIFLKQAIFF